MLNNTKQSFFVYKNKSDKPRLKIRVILAGMIGNGLEFYDFALFGVFTALFTTLFFQENNFTSLIKSLSLFSVGFVMRPLGSIIFGLIGDKLGRKKALSISITLMGVATFLIGCLPTYNEIGIYAVIGLMICRLIQGFCLGGENNGSAIFVLEHAPDHRKGLAGSLILTGGAFGTLLAMIMGAVVTSSGMPVWGWRIPFLLGLVIGLVGLYIRNKLEETPVYKDLIHQKEMEHTPLKNIIKYNLRSFMCTIGIGGVNGVFAYTLVVFINIYLTKVLNISVSHSMWNSCLGLIIFASLSPLFGLLADYFGPLKIMERGCYFSILAAIPLFYFLHQNTNFSFLTAISFASLMMASFNAPTNALLQQLFPAKRRYSGISFGYAIGAALFGGTSPIIYLFLLEKTNNPYSPALYLSLTALIGIICLRALKNNKNKIIF